MAPLIQDISFSAEDEILFDNFKSIPAPPLHESCSTEAIPAATPAIPQKRVSFGAMETTYEVMSRYEYTTQELEDTWYDHDSMLKMKQMARSEAKLVDSGLLVEGKEFSIRGLEGKTRKGILRKRKQRTNAYLSVFFEIDSQIEEGYFDDDLIADAYYVYSEPCAMAAEAVGMRDALEAEKIYNEDNNDSLVDIDFCKTLMQVDNDC